MIAGITAVQLVGIGLVIAVAGLGAFFFATKKGQKLLSSSVNNEDLTEELDLEEMTDAYVEKEVEDGNIPEQRQEVTAEMLFETVQDIEDLARSRGKKEERHKGENGSKMYNMVAFALLSSAANTLMMLYMIFL